MSQITIDRFRIVPAPLTGIGWVAVQEWNVDSGEYEHVASFRSKEEAKTFIEKQSKQH